MDMDSFVVYVKSKDVYPDLSENVERRFDTSKLWSWLTTTIKKNQKRDRINEKWIGCKSKKKRLFHCDQRFIVI